MAKFHLKPLAIKLRMGGNSILSISKKLGISKGTASLWCSEVKLSKENQRKLHSQMVCAGAIGRMRGVMANKSKKIEAIHEGRKYGLSTLKNLTKRDVVLVAAALYWAEGSKNSGRFQFVNSDPAMVRLMMLFLVDVFGVTKSELRVNIQINLIHEPRIKKVINFWSNYLNLDKSQFGKVSYIKSEPKKIYTNYDDYYGIARLRVVKSVKLLYKMWGLIEGIKPR